MKFDSASQSAARRSLARHLQFFSPVPLSINSLSARRSLARPKRAALALAVAVSAGEPAKADIAERRAFMANASSPNGLGRGVVALPQSALPFELPLDGASVGS